MREEFVSEEISPVAGSFDVTRMAAGEAGLPDRFVWREEEHEITELLETWKQLSDRFNPGEDRYLRRHWFHIRTRDGLEMKLYFERQGRPGARKKGRWWLYTIIRDEEDR